MEVTHVSPGGEGRQAGGTPGRAAGPQQLGTNLAAHAVQRTGDYAAARAATGCVVARRFRYDRGAGAAMENRGILACWADFNSSISVAQASDGGDRPPSCITASVRQE